VFINRDKLRNFLLYGTGAWFILTHLQFSQMWSDAVQYGAMW